MLGSEKQEMFIAGKRADSIAKPGDHEIRPMDSSHHTDCSFSSSKPAECCTQIFPGFIIGFAAFQAIAEPTENFSGTTRATPAAGQGKSAQATSSDFGLAFNAGKRSTDFRWAKGFERELAEDRITAHALAAEGAIEQMQGHYGEAERLYRRLLHKPAAA